MPVTARVPMCDFVILDAAGDLADRDDVIVRVKHRDVELDS